MIRRKRRYRNKSIGIRRTRIIKNTDYINIFFVIAMIIIGIILIRLGINVENNVKPIYSYEAQKKDNYEVLLKPNTFYTSEVLPSDCYYVSKSIDSFIINFQYNFEGDNKTDLEYNYNITADLVGTVKTENQDKEVWTRTFTILENKNHKQIDNNAFSIKEDIQIEYETYTSLVHSYEQTYGITIDAILKVRFNISYDINLSTLGVDNEKVEDYIELDIPITNTVTEVKENYEKITLVGIKPKVQDMRIREIVYYAFASLSLMGAIVVTIVGMKRRKSMMTPEEIHEQNVNHILKYYGDLIVTVTNEPDLGDLKVMEVTNLDDLIDIAEQNQSNIIRYEEFEKYENNLYVIVDNYVYFYKIE